MLSSALWHKVFTKLSRRFSRFDTVSNTVKILFCILIKMRASFLLIELAHDASMAVEKVPVLGSTSKALYLVADLGMVELCG